MSIDSNEDVIRAAVNVIVGPILRLLQDDPHAWSTRHCETCRTIQSLTGKSFGCYLYAKQQVARQAAVKAASK
jgi:hypothetical protein